MGSRRSEYVLATVIPLEHSGGILGIFDMELNRKPNRSNVGIQCPVFSFYR
jgi:hypothetical protein